MTLPGKAQLTAPREPANESGLCFVWCVLGALFKFWLIAKSDISDAVDDPSLYVAQVLYPMNGGLSYGPGTGLFGRFFYEFGLPFRLGIELTFMLALTWVLTALIDRPTRNYLACGLFLFAIFNPAPSALFSQFWSDQIWMVETMMALAYLVFALRDPIHPKGLPLLCSAVLFGFATITRSSFELLVSCLVFFTLASAILLWSRGGLAKFRNVFSTFLISMFALILGTASLYYATCFYNSYRHHFFGISVLDCTQYRNFYSCLQSVGEASGVNHYPVDEGRRRLIAQAGPQSRAFVERFEHDTFFKNIGLSEYGKRDVALGWFHFASFEANNWDPDSSFAIFAQIEQEIHEAARQGRIEVRPILPLPDCRLNLVLPIYPRALQSTVQMLIDEPLPYPAGWSPSKLHYEDTEFSRALTRRPVTESHVRYVVWRILQPIYTHVYTPALVILLLALVAAFWTFLAFAWQPTLENSLALLGQQLFALLFIALIFWYALFDASGMPLRSRYMMFNNVMLPILIVYYVRSFVLLYRGRHVSGHGLGAKA